VPQRLEKCYRSPWGTRVEISTVVKIIEGFDSITGDGNPVGQVIFTQGGESQLDISWIIFDKQAALEGVHEAAP
jgi:hypothetical protein